MPIPLIFAGLGALAVGAISVGGHASAQETNERAQSLAQEANTLFEKAKQSLEAKQKKATDSLQMLGNTKNCVLETSMAKFLEVYESIKDVKMSETDGLDALSNFSIDEAGVLQIREMSNIYQSAIASGTTGAVAGAAISLAASGCLPAMTGALSVAGTALMAGEFGTAASLLGSTLSFGAAFTPLAAVAAPAMLFSAISSSIKADENLEKARAMYAQAEAEAERMKVLETVCKAVSRQANMFNKLLVEMNSLFAVCINLLELVVEKKKKNRKGRIDVSEFSDEETNLIAVTRALAGAVTAIVAAPILNSDGALEDEAKHTYKKISDQMPVFEQRVEEVKAYDYSEKKVEIKPKAVNKNSTKRALQKRIYLATCMALIIAIVIMIVIIVSNKINENTITKDEVWVTVSSVEGRTYSPRQIFLRPTETDL